MRYIRLNINSITIGVKNDNKNKQIFNHHPNFLYNRLLNQSGYVFFRT